jgi:hypothetical protein
MLPEIICWGLKTVKIDSRGVHDLLSISGILNEVEHPGSGVDSIGEIAGSRVTPKTLTDSVWDSIGDDGNTHKASDVDDVTLVVGISILDTDAVVVDVKVVELTGINVSVVISLFGAVETVICASVTGNCSGCGISLVKEGANSVSVKTVGSNGQIPHFWSH